MSNASHPKECVGEDFGPTNQPARNEIADACFEAMVRHNKRRESASAKPPPIATTSGTLEGPLVEADDIDLCWGADECAAMIFPRRTRRAKENERRRRRVFRMWEEHKKAVADAKVHKRPPPANIGWVTFPQCNRVILSKSAYRAFIASQLGDGQ